MVTRILRSNWTRWALPISGAVAAGYASFVCPQTSSIREGLQSALQGNLFIFGVGVAIALFLLGNFVKGLRAS